MKFLNFSKMGFIGCDDDGDEREAHTTQHHRNALRRVCDFYTNALEFSVNKAQNNEAESSLSVYDG